MYSGTANSLRVKLNLSIYLAEDVHVLGRWTDYVRVLVNEPWAFLSLFDDAKRERRKEGRKEGEQRSRPLMAESNVTHCLSRKDRDGGGEGEGESERHSHAALRWREEEIRQEH